MPIQVTCNKCKTNFAVSEKFAGKQGPCPKCKAVITVPKLEQPPAGKAPAEEVVIHAPEEYTTGAKGPKARNTTRPIARKETRIRLIPALIVGGACLVTFVAALLMRSALADHLWMRALGLTLVSAPIVVGGYTFLRNDELEPYRDLALWIRAAICGLVYGGMWGAYGLIPADMTTTPWNWIFLGPPFFLVGAGAAFVTLDLDFDNAFFHYCFYVLVTLALGAAGGLAMPWAGITS